MKGITGGSGLRDPRSPGRLVTLVVLLALGVIVLFPTVLLFYSSFVIDGRPTLALLWKVLSEVENYETLLNTLTIGFVSTALATLIGSSVAWLLARTDLPLRHALRTFFVIPFMLPPFIAAIAWGLLLSPGAGYYNRLYSALFRASTPLFNVYSYGGIVLVSTLTFYPFVFLTVLAALEQMDPSLEEAARGAGAGTFRVMRSVTIPLVLPSIAAGSLLAFVASISQFGIPALLGTEANVFVLTTRIYRRLLETSVSFTGIREGATLALFLVLLAAIALWAQAALLGARKYTVISGKGVRPQLVRLGRLRFLFLGLLLSFLLLGILTPLGAIYLVSFLKSYGVAVAWENFTLGNYRTVLFHEASARQAILNSFFLATSAAVLTLIVGGVIAYLLVKTRFPGRRLVEFLSTLPYALPGTVIAIGMILAWNGAFYVNLYNTFWIILLAYMARYLPFAVKSVSGSLEQIHDSLEEVARGCGANWWESCRDVLIPLLKPGLVAGFLLIFMPTMRELTTSVLLYGPYTRTIGVEIFIMQENGYYGWSAALAGLVIVIILGGNVLAKAVTRGRVGL